MKHTKIFGLTPKGADIAKSIFKRYDTLKLFLTEVLEIDESTADSEATSMKHAVSEETIARLEKYINKILDLSDLHCCGYNSDNEQCKECVKITAKKRMKN